MIKKIGEFVNEKKPDKKIDSFGTLGKKLENIFTLSDSGKKQVLEITKHKPDKLLKIYLEDGRTIEATK